MRGIHYLTDEDGNRVAVQLDLAAFGDVWEDVHDVLLARERAGDSAVSLDEFEKELRKDGLLQD